MRIFTEVISNSSEPVISGLPFTQEDFHGLKLDSRNLVPIIHTIDSDLPRLLYTVLQWAEEIYGVGNIGVSVTSTRRTKKFNLLISNSGAQGSHVMGIAMDFVFTGTNAQDAWCKLKDEIISQGNLLQTLFSLGLGGIGIYGKTDKGGYFFHFDTRKQGDGLKLPNSLGTKRYSLWTKGDLECKTAKETPTTNNAKELLDRERQRENTEDRVNKYVRYVHPDEGGPVSIEDLIKDPLFIGKDLTIDQIKSTQKDNISNNERLYRNLSISEKRSYNSGNPAYNDSIDYKVTAGAIIYIRLEDIITGIDYDSNFTITKSDFNKFFPPILKQITTDPGYVPAFKNKGTIAKTIRPQATIFLWSRVKYLENELNSGFINIDQEDIISIETTNDIQSGGNFTIQLTGVGSRLVTDSTNSNKVTIEKIKTHPNVSKSNINEINISKSKESLAFEYTRVKPFYQSIISKNDMIFISFEKLKIDGKEDGLVQNKWYDMIGLVDHVEQSIDSSNESTIVVRGYSLVVALMDDHSYFNPISIGHQSSIYGESPFSNGRYLNGGFQEFASILARTIRQNLEFIVHRISSIGYVPDDIFNSFKNKTVISKYTKNTEQGTVEEEKIVRGVWQIMSLFIDDNISNLNLADSSISNPTGSILQLIQKTCQWPFVEFFTDTYGDRFYLIARKPPFEKSSLIKAALEISDEIDESFDRFKSESNQSTGTDDNESNNRYLENLLDVRFDNVSEIKQIKVGGDNTTNDLSGVTGVARFFPKIVNINEDDVIDESLRFSSESYSWYQLEEQGNFLGAKMGIGIIPGIYFDEIAQIFGNKRLTITSNYTSLNFYLDKNVDKNRNFYADQTAQQLIYLVETHLHLPFTREGILVLNPDRRIKIGNYIYYRPTKEFFYVTAVSNSFSMNSQAIERRTVVSVQRGMKLDYIRGSFETIVDKNGNQKEIEVSYFNIVDLEKLQDQIYDTVSREKVDGKFNYKGKVEINSDVLEFFLRKRDFTT